MRIKECKFTEDYCSQEVGYEWDAENKELKRLR